MDTYELMCRRPLPVKAATTNKDFDFDESLIDRVLGTPEKINIPERYIPEKQPQLAPEEEQKRSQKAEAICRLLSKSNGPIPLVLPQPNKGNVSKPQQQYAGGGQSAHYQDKLIRQGQFREAQQQLYSHFPLTHPSQYGSAESGPNSSRHQSRNMYTNHRGANCGDGQGQYFQSQADQRYFNESLNKRQSAGSANNLDDDLRRGMRGMSLTGAYGVHSVPCSPVRRSVPVKKSLSSVKRGGRSSSSYCDWSLAGVNAPSASPVSGHYSISENPKGLQVVESHSESQYCQPMSTGDHHYQQQLQNRNEKKGIRRLEASSQARGVGVPSHSHHSSYSSTSSGRSSSDREEMLHLQQNLAREVTERSRIVAVRALASSPNPYRMTNSNRHREPSPPSPVELPTVQQREGFFT